MDKLPKEFLKGIQSKDVFERYFLKSHKEANGYLYYLKNGPYNPAPEPNTEEEDGDITPIVLSDSEDIEPYRKGTGDETPDMELSDDDLALVGLKKDVKANANENEFVYMPEYRNLYEWKDLRETTRPKILRLENAYSAIDFKPVKPFYNGVWSENRSAAGVEVQEIISQIKTLEEYCFEAEHEVLNGSAKYWIGDGRFTGFFDHLYYLKQEQKNGRLYVLKKHQLNAFNLLYYCRMRKDLNNVLHMSKNGVPEAAKNIIRGVRQIIGTDGTDGTDGRTAKRRRRYLLDAPLKF